MQNIPKDLQNQFTEEFSQAKLVNWKTKGKESGSIKFAGVSQGKGGAALGRYTFAKVTGAGHFVRIYDSHTNRCLSEPTFSPRCHMIGQMQHTNYSIGKSLKSAFETHS